MSEQIVKLLTCDRCGRTAFCEKTGTGETDGGYTKWTKFKDPDEGWSTVYFTDKSIKHLCPPCTNDCREVMDNFFKVKPRSVDLPGWAK